MKEHLHTFITSALNGDEESNSRSGRFTPPKERTPVPLEYDDGLGLEPIWTFRRRKKFIVSASVGTPGTQPVTGHYTDYTITTPVLRTINFENVTFVSHCDECQVYSFPVYDAVYFGRQTFLETNYTASRPKRSQSYHNHNHRIIIVPFNTIFYLWRCDPTRVMASSFLRFSRSYTTTYYSR